jgi:hypothetical protein
MFNAKGQRRKEAEFYGGFNQHWHGLICSGKSGGEPTTSCTNVLSKCHKRPSPRPSPRPAAERGKTAGRRDAHPTVDFQISNFMISVLRGVFFHCLAGRDSRRRAAKAQGLAAPPAPMCHSHCEPPYLRTFSVCILFGIQHTLTGRRPTRNFISGKKVCHRIVTFPPYVCNVVVSFWHRISEPAKP